MILTILAIVLVVIGLNILLIGCINNNDTTIYTGGSMLFLFGFVLLVMVIVIMAKQIPANIDYQKMMVRKQTLEYRIEHREFEINDHESLYHDINSFNCEVLHHREWSNNAWTSWFYNKQIGSIELIVLTD